LRKKEAPFKNVIAYSGAPSRMLFCDLENGPLLEHYVTFHLDGLTFVQFLHASFKTNDKF